MKQKNKKKWVVALIILGVILISLLVFMFKIQQTALPTTPDFKFSDVSPIYYIIIGALLIGIIVIWIRIHPASAFITIFVLVLVIIYIFKVQQTGITLPTSVESGTVEEIIRG